MPSLTYIYNNLWIKIRISICLTPRLFYIFRLFVFVFINRMWFTLYWRNRSQCFDIFPSKWFSSESYQSAGQNSLQLVLWRQTLRPVSRLRRHLERGTIAKRNWQFGGYSWLDDRSATDPGGYLNGTRVWKERGGGRVESCENTEGKWPLGQR